MWNHIKFIRIIKKHIPFKMRIILIRVLFFIQYNYYKIIRYSIHLEKKNIFFMLSTDYSNLGDHAMSYASLKLLKDAFPDYNLIEITVNNTLKYLHMIKKHINHDDLIVLKGGGNIGIQYFREELIRRKIIELFPDNKIYIFPQTVYFPNTKLGNKEFQKTINIYNQNDNLLTILRDRVSFELVENKLKKIYLCPDIVFYLNSLLLQNQEKFISICMRNDVEGIYDNDFKKNLKEKISNSYNLEIQEFDTIKPYKIEIKDREKELLDIWNKISCSKIVITDRLHAMIFCYLLQIPCIILKTYNYKLIAQYEWIKNENFIELCETDSYVSIINAVNKLMSNNHIHKKNDFQNYFDKLKAILISNEGDI